MYGTPRATRGMDRSTSWSLGGSSQIGGGYPSRIGGMIGTRPSFLLPYFWSIRSATHGWIGIGVNTPMLNGKHPVAPAVRAAAVSIKRWRRIRNMLPLRASRTVLRCRMYRIPAGLVFSVLYFVFRIIGAGGSGG